MDRQIGIERGPAQTHRLDLGGDALAALGLELEIVHVLRLDLAADGDVKRDFLGLGQFAVRLDLLDRFERADPESSQFRNARGGAQAKLLLAQPAVVRDADARFAGGVGPGRIEFQHFDAGRVENDFLGAFEPLAVEANFHLRAALPAAGRDGVELGGTGKNSGNEQAERAEGKDTYENKRYFAGAGFRITEHAVSQV